MEGVRLHYDRYRVFDVSFGTLPRLRGNKDDSRGTAKNVPGYAERWIEDLFRQINQVAVNKLLAEPRIHPQ